jgi:hypothetical protein
MKFRATLVFLIFSALLVKGQERYNRIDVIRNQVQKINTMKGLTVKVLEGEEFLEHTPDGGAELKGYFKNGELVKIVEWIGLSSCVQITEYYLQNKKLIFVYVQGKNFEYLKPTGATRPKLVMQCRFYYENNQLIKSLMQGKTKCSDAPSMERAKEFVHSFLNYEKLIDTSS